MKNKQLKKAIKQLIEVSFRDGKMVESQVGRAVKILKSLPKYQAIEALTEYVKQLKRLERRHTLYIETVVPLSDTQHKKIKGIVEKRALPAGRQVKITKILTKINPGILGGFILKVGDEVWDESILDKVNQVKEAIINVRSD